MRHQKCGTMCHHVFKLPLYILALPFFILSAVGKGGLCAVSGGGRLWGRKLSDAHGPVPPRPPEPTPVVKVPVADVPASNEARRRKHSAFAPGLAIALFAGAAFLATVIVGAHQSQVVPGIETPSVSEFELDRLIDRVTGPQRPQIPVAFAAPPENGEDLPPGENKLGVTEESTSETMSFVLFEGTEPKGRDANALPEWAEETELTTFPELSGVIKTSPNATQADAEREAMLTLRVSLAEWFERHQDFTGEWLPPEEIVLDAGVISERAIEQTTLTVGEFEEPVFTAYWHITEPEDLKSQLFTAWRPEALKSRLLLLGGGLGLLTVLFGSMATYFRVDEATQGKYRNKLRVGTGALWALLAAGSAMMFVA
ncbi:MAG: hypothetical protein KDA93_04040 [Planctomycetaceae bacterium]|nr:hypothetical protein [Planctomycetaceae bacterium]